MPTGERQDKREKLKGQPNFLFQNTGIWLVRRLCEQRKPSDFVQPLEPSAAIGVHSTSSPHAHTHTMNNVENPNTSKQQKWFHWKEQRKGRQRSQKAPHPVKFTTGHEPMSSYLLPLHIFSFFAHVLEHSISKPSVVKV